MTENGHLVAYCGLLCGDCFNHKGKIADLARDLRKELRQESFETVSKGLSKYFRHFENYEQCYEVLGAMVRLRCKRTCRGGGGPRPAGSGDVAKRRYIRDAGNAKGSMHAKNWIP